LSDFSEKSEDLVIRKWTHCGVKMELQIGSLAFRLGEWTESINKIIW